MYRNVVLCYWNSGLLSEVGLSSQWSFVRGRSLIIVVSRRRFNFTTITSALVKPVPAPYGR